MEELNKVYPLAKAEAIIEEYDDLYDPATGADGAKDKKLGLLEYSKFYLGEEDKQAKLKADCEAEGKSGDALTKCVKTVCDKDKADNVLTGTATCREAATKWRATKTTAAKAAGT